MLKQHIGLAAGGHHLAVGQKQRDPILGGFRCTTHFRTDLISGWIWIFTGT